jgi:hypothetical protein
MTDQELRALIRDSIARHLPAAGVAQGARPSAGADPRQPGTHASHGRLSLVRGGDDDGQCLIEPSVRCNHCGYCQSFGH